VTTRQHKVHTQLGRAAVQMFAANDRMNQLLIEHLDPAAWRAKPPGKTRTIAAIFTHMHNVRSKWVRLTVPHLKVPRQGGPHREVSPRRLGSGFSGWPGNAVLHACSRSPPSRAGVYARASARIPVAVRGGGRDLELGKAVERVRVAWRPRLRFLRNRSRAQAARGWAAMVVETLRQNRSESIARATARLYQRCRSATTPPSAS
jgi:hypothetical protein